MTCVLVVLLLCWTTPLTSLAQDGPDPNAHRFQALKDLVWLDYEWVLAFRLTAGVQRSSYESYTGPYNDDQPLSRAFLPSGCLQPHSSPACCGQHYHGALLNSWPSRYIDQVRVSLLKGESEVAHVLFNGSGSSPQSWFSEDRVLNSSWTDLTSKPHNIFSIKGHGGDGRHSRRFFVNRNYGGCRHDHGWMVVVDNGDPCSWAQDDSYPSILYSIASTAQNYNTGSVDRADAMIIAVKLNVPFDQDTC